MSRIVVQFSCGAASAVAAKIAVTDPRYKGNCKRIINAYVEEEHPDNRRFLADVERWIGYPITVLRDEKYGASVLEVWRRERYIKGPNGAACAIRVKRRLLNAFAHEHDIHVIGYTAEEVDRAEEFEANNPHLCLIYPLIEATLTKADCLAMIERAGIKLPEMYLLGFNNANCIGCCKGGKGYFNKVRKHFPERFYQIADIQDAIGPGSYFWANDDGSRMSLRDLPLDAGSHKEPEISCSLFCDLTERDIADRELA